MVRMLLTKEQSWLNIRTSAMQIGDICVNVKR